MKSAIKTVLISILGLVVLSAQSQNKKKPSMSMGTSMLKNMHRMGSKAKQEGMKMHTTMKDDSASVRTYYYTCPMKSHRHIHSDEPGTCPECNMDMVQAVAATTETADFYGCPMPAHSNVRSEEPGKCPECNMDLQPMQIEKGGRESPE